MEACMRTIEKLNRLNKSRPDPADTLINIAEVCQDCDLNDEGWTNFYSYITTTDRSTWQYLTDIPTLGDLSEEHLAKIEEDLQKQVSDVGVMHKSYENGIETFVDVKYFDPILKRMANKWLDFVKQYRKKHPGQTLKQSLKGASVEYKKTKSAPAKKKKKAKK